VEYSRSTQELLSHCLSEVLRRRKKLVFMAFLAATVAALAFHHIVGTRYEAYVLLRVGQGIKDRSAETASNLFDGVDLAARIESVARIGTTDYVIRQAADQVGREKFEKNRQSETIANAKALIDSWVGYLLAGVQLIFPDTASTPNATSSPRRPDPSTALVYDLRDQITARQEGRSDILRISFRNADPGVAVDFVNNLGNILVANYADVIQVLGADSFFHQQTKRFEEEAEKAAEELRAFSVSASIYSVVDQRTLLLKRLNDLAAQLVATRGSIVEKKGFKTGLMDELMLLRPVYQSRMVSGIVKSLGGPDYQPDKSVLEANRSDYGETPPILMIKVYQDNMATLMKVNADILGSVSLEKSLGAEIAAVNSELALLTAKEAEYDRLRRTLARASAAAENYGSRTIEEKIKADIAKRAQLSSVRVIQNADVPFGPVFPNSLQLVLLTLLIGLGSGTALALMLELSAARRADESREIENAGQIIRYYRRDEMANPAE